MTRRRLANISRISFLARYLCILVFAVFTSTSTVAQKTDGFLESGIFIFPVNNSQNSLSFYHTRLILGRSELLLKSANWNYSFRFGGFLQQGILNSSGSNFIPEYYINSGLSPLQSLKISFYASHGISTPNRLYTKNTLLTTKDWGISLQTKAGKYTRIRLAFGFQDYIRGGVSSGANYIRLSAQRKTEKHSFSYNFDRYLSKNVALSSRYFLRYRFHPSRNFSFISTLFTYPYASRQSLIFHDKLRWTPNKHREIQQEFYSGIYNTSLSEYYRTRLNYFQRRQIRGRWFRSLHLDGDLFRSEGKTLTRWWSINYGLDWITRRQKGNSGSILAGFKDDSRYGRGFSFQSRAQFFHSKPLGWLNILLHNLFEGEFLYTGSTYNDITNRSKIDLIYQKNHFRITQKNNLILHAGQDLFIYPDTIRTGWIEELSYLIMTNGFNYSGGMIYQSDYYGKLSGTRIYQRFRWTAGRHSSLNLYLNLFNFEDINQRNLWIALFWKYHVPPFNLTIEGNYRDLPQRFRWNRLNFSIRFIREFL